MYLTERQSRLSRTSFVHIDYTKGEETLSSPLLFTDAICILEKCAIVGLWQQNSCEGEIKENTNDM